MDRRWLVVLLGVSLLANGIFFTLWLRERAQATAAAAEVSAITPVAETTPLPRPTATRRPQPAISQATRVTLPPTETATTEPTPSPTPEPTAEPTAEPQPTTPPEPTASPEPPASPTLEAAGTDWLQFVNLFRGEANLPPLLEEPLWSLDSEQHSRYMVFTGNIGHNQDPASPYHTAGGQIAAENGNVAAGYIGSDPYEWAFNYWMSAPFHAIPILDPQLGTTGFAEYRDPTGVTQLAATLDVRRGLRAMPDGVTFPIMYPRDGGRTWVLRYSLPEFPEALSTCAGYQQPTGAPIILQLGDGSGTPQVTATSLFKDGEYLAHCRFDETNFTHPNEFRQRSARLILDNRDAVVIIPQEPLLPDATYSVRVDANGATYTWSFQTAAGPP
jgi:uncharacterized protein YkwD